jgi:hypothetical protein
MARLANFSVLIAAKFIGWLNRKNLKQFKLLLVESASSHGHGLSYQEKIAASMILQRDNYDPQEIAKIVHIPLDSLAQAIQERGAWLSTEDIKPVVAKAPIAKEAKRKGREWLENAAANGLDQEQKFLSGSSFERLADEILVLLTDDHLDAEDNNIVQLVSQLQGAAAHWLMEHSSSQTKSAA